MIIIVKDDDVALEHNTDKWSLKVKRRPKASEWQVKFEDQSQEKMLIVVSLLMLLYFYSDAGITRDLNFSVC